MYSTLQELKSLSISAGLFFSIWAPGDGKMRYRFNKKNVPYHQSEGIFTAMGRKEAIAFLRGYRACKNND